MNLKVKFRESFRPFAPIVRRERVADYFEMEVASSYMLLVAPVKKELCREVPLEIKGFDRLKSVRFTLPAITHVDYSARIQTWNAKAIRSYMNCCCASRKQPVAACWSIRHSMCAGSRLFARPTTRIVVS